MARIYLASSWRNEQQPDLVRQLRGWGHEVYDFRNPPHRDGGFAWSDIDKGWKDWSAHGFREKLLNDPIASHGYLADYRAMEWADTVVCLLPCGRSAHLELGWAAGRGKRTVVVLADGCEPELMYLMCGHLVVSPEELRQALGSPASAGAGSAVRPPLEGLGIADAVQQAWADGRPGVTLTLCDGERIRD